MELIIRSVNISLHYVTYFKLSLYVYCQRVVRLDLLLID